MSEKIDIGDKFECVRKGETQWSVFEIKESRDDRYIVQWPDGRGAWGNETLLASIGDGTVRRVYPGPAVAQTATTPSAQTQVATPPITQTAIRAMLPADLRELPLFDAIRQLVQVYVARKCDSDSATTVQELRALVDRMRRERISNVSSRKEIMADNEWSI